MGKRMKPKKTVRIADTNNVDFYDVSDGEILKTWYNDKDYKQFEEDIEKTINKCSIVGNDICSIDLSKDCLRGIEYHLTNQMRLIRRINASRIRNIVLEQQRYQKMSGKKDSKLLAALSMMFSRKSRERALKLAVMSATQV